MDYLKFKLATARKSGRQERFGYSNPAGDLTKPELLGLLPCNEDYEFATPNLIRNENISLTASNTSSKNTLQLNLKWRPYNNNNNNNDGSKALATLVTDFKLVINNVVYEYKQIETYVPQESNIRQGRLVQYGSNKSNLKFLVNSPYRRYRLIFRGNMSVKKANEEEEEEDSIETKAFVKLNLVLCATSSVYDFADQYDAQCFRESYNQNLENYSNGDNNGDVPLLGYSDTLNQLLLHDNHEHSVRVAGNCSINGGINSFDDVIFMWGFYSRQFLSTPLPKSVERKQIKRIDILTNISNGQMFHIGLAELNKQRIHFGYTCFAISSLTKAIEKPFILDGITNKDDSSEKCEMSEKTQHFKVKVFGQGTSFDVIAKKRDNNLDCFYDVDFNVGIPGWAFVSVERQFGYDEQELEMMIEKSRSDYLERIQHGLIANLKYTNNINNDSSPLLISIEEDLCCSSDLVGSKAASLALLKKFSNKASSSYKVSDAFVLTKFAYEMILLENPQINEELSKLESLIGDEKLNELKENCDRIVNLFTSELKLPQKLLELVDELLESSSKQFNKETSFAIRSSAWGEDEQDMSAAGQLTTLLGVKGLDNIAQAIMACFGSKFSYENVEYKRQHGLPLGAPMAVIIQEMINCDKAGVMFSCLPTTGDDTIILITANYGLGESIVSGQTEPDSIKVRRSFEDNSLKIEEVNIGSKLIVTRNEEKKEGEDENKQDKTKCCLNEEEILTLAKCSIELVDYHESPRDIEWGFVKSNEMSDGSSSCNQLVLFQSRFITGLDIYTEFELIHEADLATRAENNYLTRANIGEVTTFALKPLTLTYSVYFWAVMGARMFKKISSVDVPSVNSAQEVINDSYHSFFNLRGSTLFPINDKDDASLSEEAKLMSKAMQVGFFGHDIKDPSDLIEASRGIVRIDNPFVGRRYEFYTYLLRKMPMIVVMKEKQIMAWLRKQVRDKKLATGYEQNKMLGLYNQMKNVVKYSYNGWENHINIIMLAGVVNMRLSAFLSHYIKDPNQLYAALSKFFATSPNVISAEIPERIRKIAQLIKLKANNEEKLKLFTDQETSFEKCLEFIRNDEEIFKKYQEFLELFGHRCYNEFELSASSWAQNQSVVIDMLKKNCLPADDKISLLADDRKLPTIDEVIDSLELGSKLGPKERLLLKNDLVPRVQLMVASRERTKDVIVEYCDILREATKMLAKEMLINLRIPDVDLFYYLYYDELEPLVREAQPSIVLHAIRRRNVWKIFKKPWIFDEIICGHHFIPNHLKPTKELDDKIIKASKLYGTPASSGKVQGKVCLIHNYNELNKVRPGDILLTHSTDIGFSPVFPLISGIITEVGGLISHGAVVAREYGLPSILGIPDITMIIQDGEEIILDANNGVIIRLNHLELSS